MNLSYIHFEKAIKPLICFSARDVKKHFPGFDRKRLTDWQRKGYIKKLIKENYIFNDLERDKHLWWYVANALYKPSYVSLQSALSYYDFIPEGVFQVTSITTKRTKTIDTGEMSFAYRNIKKPCFFGYRLLQFRNRYFFKMAGPEKALLDLLYMEPNIKEEADFEAWRFNKPQMLETININLIETYASHMNNSSFKSRVNNFKKWLYA